MIRRRIFTRHRITLMPRGLMSFVVLLKVSHICSTVAATVLHAGIRLLMETGGSPFPVLACHSGMETPACRGRLVLLSQEASATVRVQPLWGRFRTARAQRGHSANYYGDYPHNNPENHPPAESCTINSKLKNSNI